MKTTFNKTDHEALITVLFKRMRKGMVNPSLSMAYKIIQKTWLTMDNDSDTHTYTLEFSSWLKTWVLNHFPEHLDGIFPDSKDVQVKEPKFVQGEQYGIWVITKRTAKFVWIVAADETYKTSQKRKINIAGDGAELFFPGGKYEAATPVCSWK